jgi:transcriptional regulator with XRE-family HTH domain
MRFFCAYLHCLTAGLSILADMKNDTSGFGKKLRTLREAAGLSQIAFAKKMRTTQRGISKWEIGETFPGYESLVRLGKVLKVHPGEFF